MRDADDIFIDAAALAALPAIVSRYYASFTAEELAQRAYDIAFAMRDVRKDRGIEP
jgi:hypothetical protein